MKICKFNELELSSKVTESYLEENGKRKFIHQPRRARRVASDSSLNRILITVEIELFTTTWQGRYAFMTAVVQR